jgi:hypothetical protein
MTNSWILRPMLGLGIASMAAFGVADAQPLNAPNLANVVAPRLSAPRLKYFQAHPAEWQKFVANLPLRPTTDTPTVNRYVPAKAGLAGGTWQTVKPAPSFGLCNPLLMTDGTVIVHNCYTPDWYKLTPDINGNYTTGTWSQIASMPVVNGTQYAPQYNASAVLPGGRVIVIGGEYNGGQGAVWTNLGAEYLPVANGWVPISAPDGGTGGWASIGDSESTVLADGTFLLGACCGYPDVDALFDAMDRHRLARCRRRLPGRARLHLAAVRQRADARHLDQLSERRLEQRRNVCAQERHLDQRGNHFGVPARSRGMRYL